MDRNTNDRFRENEGRPLISPYLITAIVVMSAVVLSVLFWYLFGTNPGRFGAGQSSGEETSETAAYAADEMEDSFLPQQPEKEDGSGGAGIMKASDYMLEISDEPGWHSDMYGWWYSPKENGIYYSGWAEIDDKTYHFAENGYASVGWTAIGGEGYYFDNDRVYQPDENKDLLIALTFDDGPGMYTDRLLDILEKNNAKATFFLLGREIPQYGGVIPRMIAQGNLVGNHSYDHLEMLEQDMETVLDQFNRTDELIAQYNNGNPAPVVRFPYGDYTKEQTAAVGRPQIYWDLDTFDWDSGNINDIRQHLYEYLTGGNIILMHDIYDTTVDACEVLIPELQSQGYKFVTAEELAASRGYTLTPGVTYLSFKDKNIEEGRVTDEGE